MASSGCAFRYHYSGGSTRSRRCRDSLAAASKLAAGSCGSVAVGEKLPGALLCYSDLPADGLYVAANGSGFAVSVTNTLVMDGEAMQGVVPMHSGRNMIKVVETSNLTVAEGGLGRLRLEFFATLLSPSVLAGSTTSVHSSCTAFAAANVTTHMSLDSSWVSITVAPAWKTAYEVFGEVGGAVGLVVNFASALLLAYVLTTGKHKAASH